MRTEQVDKATVTRVSCLLDKHSDCSLSECHASEICEGSNDSFHLSYRYPAPFPQQEFCFGHNRLSAREDPSNLEVGDRGTRVGITFVFNDS